MIKILTIILCLLISIVAVQATSVTRSFSDTTISESGELQITYDRDDQYSVLEPVPAGWSHVSGPGQVTDGMYRLTASSPKTITFRAPGTSGTYTWYGEYAIPGGDWLDFPSQQIVVGGGGPPPTENGGFGSSMIFLVVGGAALLYFMTRKK